LVISDIRLDRLSRMAMVRVRLKSVCIIWSEDMSSVPRDS